MFVVVVSTVVLYIVLQLILQVEQAVKKYGRKDITWSTQGMLRLQPNVMMELFRPVVDKIVQVGYRHAKIAPYDI
jgi:hypothetical protein